MSVDEVLVKMQGEIDALKARIAELERITERCEHCRGSGREYTHDHCDNITGTQRCYYCDGTGFKIGAMAP